MKLKECYEKWLNREVWHDEQESTDEYCRDTWEAIECGLAELVAAQKEIERLKQNQMSSKLAEAMAELRDVVAYDGTDFNDLKHVVQTLLDAAKEEA